MGVSPEQGPYADRSKKWMPSVCRVFCLSLQIHSPPALYPYETNLVNFIIGSLAWTSGWVQTTEAAVEDQRVRAGERGLGSLPLGCCGPQLLLGALSLLAFFCLLGPGVITVLCCGQSQGAFPSLVDYPKPCPAVVNSPLIGLWSSQCPCALSLLRQEAGGWRLLLFDSAAGDQVPGMRRRVRLSLLSKGALRLTGDTEGPAPGASIHVRGMPTWGDGDTPLVADLMLTALGQAALEVEKSH